MNKSLNIKYSLTQIFFNASICAMFGFASVYLLDQGFSNSAIGMILASCSVVAVFLQPMMASIADKSEITHINKILQEIILVTVVLALVLFLFPLNKAIVAILVVAVFSIMSSMMPLLNALTFVFEDAGYKINFGVARGLGSAAYAVASSVLGFMTAKFAPHYIPLTYLSLNILLYLVIRSFTLPESENKKVVEKTEEKQQLSLVEFAKKYHKFIFFLGGFVCIYFAHGIINNFFIQVVSNIGGNSQDMGNAVFVAAMVELPTMFLFEKINQKFKCSTLIKISLVCFTIKHVLTYFASNIAIIYVAQILQIGAFALFIPASVYYVKQKIGQEDMVKGQSLVTMAMALSGVFASLFGGILLDVIGVSKVLLLGGILSVIGLVIGLLTIED